MKITDGKCLVLKFVAAEPGFRWRTGLPGDGNITKNSPDSVDRNGIFGGAPTPQYTEICLQA